ncbi:MAG TPA: annexin [Acidobacteriota bacterium]|jgi:hypothetical protein
MPRIGNEPTVRPIELPQEEPIGTSISEGSSAADVPELEHPVRSSSGASTQAAESALAAQAQQSELRKQLLEKRADAIHDACAGIGTDEAKVFRNLTGLSAEEKKQLDQIYKQKFGISLEEQLKDEMSGPELEKAMGLLFGASTTQPQEAERGERVQEE